MLFREWIDLKPIGHHRTPKVLVGGSSPQSRSTSVAQSDNGIYCNTSGSFDYHFLGYVPAEIHSCESWLYNSLLSLHQVMNPCCHPYKCFLELFQLQWEIWTGVSSWHVLEPQTVLEKEFKLERIRLPVCLYISPQKAMVGLILRF